MTERGELAERLRLILAALRRQGERLGAELVVLARRGLDQARRLGRQLGSWTRTTLAPRAGAAARTSGRGARAAWRSTAAGSRRAGRAALAGSHRAARSMADRTAQARTRALIRRRARRAATATAAPHTGAALTLGLPVPLIVVALVLAAGMGLLLTYALSLTTQTSVTGSSAGLEDGTGVGKNLAAPIVVTESTLGPEVQRLVDTGSLQSAADLDVPGCLTEQGISDKVLIMEEIEWGSGTQRAWLIVHSTGDPAQLRTRGGPVNATVVLPTCGSSRTDASASRLWSGSTILSPASS